MTRSAFGRAVFVGLILSLLETPGLSAEMISLTEWANLPEDERESSYIYTRCAGLFRGILSYVPEERLGQETAKKYESGIVLTSAAAVVTLQTKEPNANSLGLVERVERDRDAISKLYKERMYKNYQTTGQAFWNDKLIRDDLDICGAVAEQLGKKWSVQ